MAIVMDPYERYDTYRDTALDAIVQQIKLGNIQCGRNATKLKYGVPPKEVKGWWLTNDRHRTSEQKEEKTEPGRSSDNSEHRKRKQNLIDLLREVDKRRNSGKHRD